MTITIVKLTYQNRHRKEYPQMEDQLVSTFEKRRHQLLVVQRMYQWQQRHRQQRQKQTRREERVRNAIHCTVQYNLLVTNVPWSQTIGGLHHSQWQKQRLMFSHESSQVVERKQ